MQKKEPNFIYILTVQYHSTQEESNRKTTSQFFKRISSTGQHFKMHAMQKADSWFILAGESSCLEGIVKRDIDSRQKGGLYSFSMSRLGGSIIFVTRELNLIGKESH